MTLNEPRPDTAAIVLAGGSGSRMGGVDKPGLVVGTRSMLSTALAAVERAGRRVVVGPPRSDLPSGVLRVQETPPGSGPLAAIAAGLAELHESASNMVVVMASDLPAITTATVESLIEKLRGSPATVEAVFAADDRNRVQFLLAVWRTEALRDRLRSAGGSDEQLRNKPVKAIMPAEFSTLHLQGTEDCDTTADLEHARGLLNRQSVALALSLTEARAAILSGLSPLPPRMANLDENFGARLAEPLRATSAMPPVNISAMDGYAVAGNEPWLLQSHVQVAGGIAADALSPGEAVRIATGASVPRGASAVIRDEHIEFSTMSERSAIKRRSGAPHRNDMRMSGEDWCAGDVLAPAGTRVGAAVISVAASGETAQASIRGPVRALVTLTGDEIRRHGPLAPGQTRDSLGPVIERFLAQCGIVTIGIEHSADTAAHFDNFLTAADQCDLMVVVGATGGGAADRLRTVIAQNNAHVIVGRVRCRPGGSQLTAVLPDGRVILGLPGNPYAAVATLLTMAPAIVAALSATSIATPTTGILANAAQLSSPDSSRIVPVSQRGDGPGFGHWVGDAENRTAHLRALVNCTHLAVVPANAADGDTVELIGLPS